MQLDLQHSEGWGSSTLVLSSLLTWWPLELVLLLQSLLLLPWQQQSCCSVSTSRGACLGRPGGEGHAGKVAAEGFVGHLQAAVASIETAAARLQHSCRQLQLSGLSSHGHVDEAIRATDGHSWLGPVLGEGVQAAAGTATQDDSCKEGGCAERAGQQGLTEVDEVLLGNRRESESWRKWRGHASWELLQVHRREIYCWPRLTMEWH